MKLEIYCDGSATIAELPGGWSYVIVIEGIEYKRESGGLHKATNNVAEIQAAIEGMQFVLRCQSNGLVPITEDLEITLVSDSQLVLRYASGQYQCKAFHLIPYYTKLRTLYKTLNASGRWVKGHNGNHFNEICDKLAKSARVAIETDLLATK